MKQKDIFYIVVSSFIVVVIWIAANLWHIQNASKLSETVIKQSSPITPSFDTGTLAKLKERSQAAPLFTIKRASQAATLTPSPIPTSIPTPTLEVNPSISPTISSTPTLSP